jgi:hypothetical protein
LATSTEPILNDATHVEREFLWSLCRRKMGCDGACVAAVALDLIDLRVGLARGAAMADQHLGASFPKGQSGCAADTRDAPATGAVLPERLVMIVDPSFATPYEASPQSR